MQLARQTPRLRAFRWYFAAFVADHEKFVARPSPLPAGQTAAKLAE
jgi:hypothetical protein